MNDQGGFGGGGGGKINGKIYNGGGGGFTGGLGGKDENTPGGGGGSYCSPTALKRSLKSGHGISQSGKCSITFLEPTEIPNDEEVKIDKKSESDSGVHSLPVPESSLPTEQSIEVGIWK